MTQATNSAGTSFALEKAVVAAAAILTATFTLIHLTGLILAVAAGGPAPTFSPARALGVVRLEPYAPGIPAIVHLVAIGIVIVAVLKLARRAIRWRARRTASTAQRAAAFDALPLLKKAETVRVVRIDPQKDPALRGSIAGADLAGALARHGIKADAQGYPTDGLDEGQALMRCAEDTGAGLIVMGAYGHSRLAELIFGGATRFVLTRMSRPVLMSH